MKQNKLYKVLRIVFLTLAIISMVFALCRKVGLCASGGSVPSVSSLPLPVGAGWGNNFSLSEYEYILQIAEQDRINCNDSGYTFIGAIVISEVSSDGSFRLRCYQGPGFSVSSPSNFLTSNGSNLSWYYVNANNYGGCRELVFNSDGTFNNGWWRSSGAYITVNSNTFLSSLPDNSLGVLYGHPYTGYPIYINSDIVYDGVTYFSNAPQHSQGGTLSDYSDQVQEFIDSDINGVDVDPPSDPSSSSNWFQKVLNALKTINNSIGGGFSLISNGISGIYGYFTEPFDQSAFESSFYSIPFVSDLRSLTGLVSSSGLFDWSSVSPASRVAFTFDFGGAVLPHHEYEINFDWYTGNVKTIILSVVTTFLVIGLLATIINQIPSIIHGHSGDKGGGSD